MPDSDRRTDSTDKAKDIINQIRETARADGERAVKNNYPALRRPPNEIDSYAHMLADEYLISIETPNLSDEVREAHKKIYLTYYSVGYSQELARQDKEAFLAGTPHEEIGRDWTYTHWTREPKDRKQIINNGEHDGRKEASELYPYIKRLREEIEDYAQERVRKYLVDQTGNFTDDIEEYKRLYVTGYVAGYLEELAELDEKAGKKPIITVTRVERRASEYVYYLELVDPGYIEGVYKPEPLTIVF